MSREQRRRSAATSRLAGALTMVMVVALTGVGCERLAGIHSSSKRPGDAGETGVADSGADRGRDTGGAGNGGHDAAADTDLGDLRTTDGGPSGSDGSGPSDARSDGDASAGDASADGAADGPFCGPDPSVGSPIKATAFRFGGGPNNSSDPNGKGQCGFPNGQLPKAMFYGAVDPSLYATASRCGTCMRLVSGGVSVEVQVIDVVPALPAAHGSTIAIDQSAQTILSPGGGNPDVQFSFVPCAPTGNIRVAFQGALDPSLVVMDHRNELKSVQLVTAGTTQNMTRQSYNVWTTAGTFGGGRVSLVLADVFGNTVRTPDMALSTAFVDTGQQFRAVPTRNPRRPPAWGSLDCGSCDPSVACRNSPMDSRIDSSRPPGQPESGPDPLSRVVGDDEEIRFVWIDLEMTGLNPDVDQILEMAVVVTGPDLRPLGELTRVIRQPEETLERMSKVVQRMHTRNGLIEEVLASTTSLREAERAAMGLVVQHCLPGASFPVRQRRPLRLAGS